MQNEQIFWPLTNDVMIQMFFTAKRNKPLLKQFLKATTHLTDDDLYIIEVEDSKLTKDSIYEKDFIVDINLTSKSGRNIMIEMQNQYHPGFEKRVVSYNARRLSSDLAFGTRNYFNYYNEFFDI